MNFILIVLHISVKVCKLAVKIREKSARFWISCGTKIVIQFVLFFKNYKIAIANKFHSHPVHIDSLRGYQMGPKVPFV